jgi:hypothetical protein
LPARVLVVALCRAVAGPALLGLESVAAIVAVVAIMDFPYRVFWGWGVVLGRGGLVFKMWRLGRGRPVTLEPRREGVGGDPKLSGDVKPGRATRGRGLG